MSGSNTPSAIPRPRPRPRVTSNLFRPPPPTTSLPPYRLPIPSPSALPLNVNRKRARAETVSTTPDRVSKQSESIESPRAFSTSFAISRSDASKEEVTLSSLLAPSTHSASTCASTGDVGQEPFQDPTNSMSTTWKASILNVATAVAGGLIDFCRRSSFLGFRAGAGRQYDAGSYIPSTNNDQARSSPRATSRPDNRQFSWGAPNLPGYYPAGDVWSNSSKIDEEDPQETRSVKRRQISQGGDWVMVSPTSPQDFTPTSPRSISQSHIPRPSPRSSTIRRLNPVASPRRTSSIAPTPSGGSRRTSTITHTSKSLRSARSMSSLSAQPSTAVQGTMNYEITTLRSPRGSTMTSADVARFRNKKDREERQADASLRKLNDQLRAMIREGKAALGTKVEVESDDDDDDV